MHTGHTHPSLVVAHFLHTPLSLSSPYIEAARWKIAHL